MICRLVKTSVHKNSVNLSESIMQFYTPVELREIMLIPFYSDLVQCGFPSPAQDHVEQRIDLNELLINHPVRRILSKPPATA